MVQVEPSIDILNNVLADPYKLIFIISAAFLILQIARDNQKPD